MGRWVLPLTPRVHIRRAVEEGRTCTHRVVGTVELGLGASGLFVTITDDRRKFG